MQAWKINRQVIIELAENSNLSVKSAFLIFISSYMSK